MLIFRYPTPIPYLTCFHHSHPSHPLKFTTNIYFISSFVQIHTTSRTYSCIFKKWTSLLSQVCCSSFSFPSLKHSILISPPNHSPQPLSKTFTRSYLRLTSHATPLTNNRLSTDSTDGADQEAADEHKRIKYPLSVSRETLGNRYIERRKTE